MSRSLRPLAVLALAALCTIPAPAGARGPAGPDPGIPTPPIPDDAVPADAPPHDNTSQGAVDGPPGGPAGPIDAPPSAPPPPPPASPPAGPPPAGPPPAGPPRVGPPPVGPQTSNPAAQVVCPDTGALTLAAAEVEQLLRAAAAAVDGPLVAAVVDRAGRPLGLYRRALGAGADDRAVGLARTGAFFSNDQAPLSSRTVRFVSGIHFPPGIPNTPNAALYGIENTNRGCDLGVPFLPGKALPPARSVVFAGGCNAFDRSACGTGPVTGKSDLFDSQPRSVDPGGVPIFRGAALVGGLGVVVAGAPEFAAFAAIAGVPGLSPVPTPLPAPGVVFIDGIRLPFVRQVDRPAGTAPGDPNAGSIALGPTDGSCVPDGWLVGPRAGSLLSAADVERIVQQARQAALRTRAVIRLPLGSRARMVIAVGDVDGSILGLFRMRDATVFSVDVAVAKARNVAWFSSPAGAGDLAGLAPGTAVTNRTISFGAQPLFPAGIDGTGVGPFWDLFVADTATPCSQGSQPPNANQSGIVFFPGSIPLYTGGQLAGGLGISGDGVEQDDYVSFLGAAGFEPPADRWADRSTIRGVRMPFLKFPRNPER
ncbi:MAG: heme-binding protein [Acidobacteriota bacterium]